MKAIIWTKYGPPEALQLREVEKPAPGEKEVLIKIHAATVTAGDCESRSLRFPLLFRIIFRIYFGLTKPRNKIPGQELSGTVELTGKKVTRFKKGDEVVAATLLRLGAYAEYICLPEKYPIMLKPANFTFGEAATIPTGGVNGLHFLKKAKVRSGDAVLINGAGGSIGTYAVQLAKSFGAKATAVDSAEKLAMLRSIGANHVIDYAQEDFTQSGKAYDAIIDVAGKSRFSQTLKCLKPNGRYVLGNPSFSGMIRGLWTSWISDKNILFEMADYKTEDMDFLKKLMETGKIKPVIDKYYSLGRVPEAHRYVETGRKKGNVVIAIDQPLTKKPSQKYEGLLRS